MLCYTQIQLNFHLIDIVKSEIENTLTTLLTIVQIFTTLSTLELLISRLKGLSSVTDYAELMHD